MSDQDKNTNKKELNKDIILLVDKKIEFFKDVIQKTIIYVQKNKTLDILGISDVTLCVEKLSELNKKITELINDKNTNHENVIHFLQDINNDLSGILKTYGTDSLEDLMLICFGNNAKIIINETDDDKYNLLKKYFHPTSYKVVNKKDDKNKKTDWVDDKTTNLSCYNVDNIYKEFHMKVYGMKLYIHTEDLKKCLIIFGVVDDVIIKLLNNNYINKKIKTIMDSLPQDILFKPEIMDTFISSLLLKDFFVYENCTEVFNKYIGHLSENKTIMQKQTSQIVKDFITDSTYNKRNILINLLINSLNKENQYLAYLLYDLLSNDSNGNIDTQEQIIIFDSFPWPIKQSFKNAMKNTIQYTNELSNFDINKIPLEQQICLLKASDVVKEKAMVKLKEVKSKTEDTGSKARQYLDGLLKIPFNIYKREPILQIMKTIKTQFKTLYEKYNITNVLQEIPNKEKYTNIEIIKYINTIICYFQNDEYYNNELDILKTHLTNGNKQTITTNINLINDLQQSSYKIKYSKMNKDDLVEEIHKFIEDCKQKSIAEKKTIISHFNIVKPSNLKIIDDIVLIQNNITQIQEYMKDVKTTLDLAVHGHNNAKKQISKIISQWINGEQSGYCFGFEGSPGVGKTSLAKKGLSGCLKDQHGVARPFSLIAIGGDSNASSLVGHGYTYVGSTWGQLVQILMDKKCMNPIILIDEVDKISKTEHGKELIGILTHLLDPTQNEAFQDKYFTGVDLDLSKVLFILSYNDANLIDRILLDRIHRIKFDNLTTEDKLIICKDHILPEIYTKMGLENVINFDDEAIQFIIDEYTLESGVRKLKEVLFEIIGEINLDMLKTTVIIDTIPLNITVESIKKKYLKNKQEIIIRQISNKNEIGFVNGMYATSIGNGGTLPIHAKFFPSNIFLDLKLTGLQQEVMRESMHVSLTVAWNLTDINKQEGLRQKYDTDNNKCGINIHTGDGSVQKDGPSGGLATTIAIYSLLNDLRVKHEFGITGEIQMSGEVTAIGGLSNKILGSIKSSVKSFIFPQENKKDFDEFYDKYKDDPKLIGIQFFPVNNILEALDVVIDK